LYTLYNIKKVKKIWRLGSLGPWYRYASKRDTTYAVLKKTINTIKHVQGRIESQKGLGLTVVTGS